MPSVDDVWVSCNHFGDNHFASLDITKHVLAISFDRAIARCFSRFRILLVAPKLSESWSLSTPTVHSVHYLRTQASQRKKSNKQASELTLLLSTWQSGDPYWLKATITVDNSPFVKGVPVLILHESALDSASSASGLLISLDLTTSFPRHRQMTTNYYIYIAKCNGGPYTLQATLQPSIIRRIFQFCIAQPDPDTKERLVVRLSEVSKAWHAVSAEFFDDIFLDLTSGPALMSHLTLPAIAGMLLQDPSRGADLEWLPPVDFRASRSSVDGGRGRNTWLHYVGSLYGHLPDLKGVHTISPLLFRAREELSKLKKVRFLRVTEPTVGEHGYWGHDEDSIYGYQGETNCISDIIYITQNWSDLEELDLVGGDLYSKFRQGEIPEKAPAYSLSRLSLSRVYINSGRILHIICGKIQSLSRLHLKKVKGLSLTDYTIILWSVAPTIEDLMIRRCKVERGDNELNEELPLDSTIPSMPHIRTVVVQPELASNLSIARKMHTDIGDGPETKIFIIGYYMTDLVAATDRVGLGLAECLQLTGWGSVSVSFGATGKGLMTTVEKQKHVGTAYEVARTKGMEFMIIN